MAHSVVKELKVNSAWPWRARVVTSVQVRKSRRQVGAQA
jgi:hypothetical protein